jgi:hypothetical protein
MTKDQLKKAGDQIAAIAIYFGGRLEKDGRTVAFPTPKAAALFRQFVDEMPEPS